ncbi:hypothetical protein FK220_003945 [Flavobacteriaceae bacterium TP-CH-4]|uniref:Uncharacterized protein n=1 Tax=Pelagihabitans pacificus TaxID=2696054 RepID=A0A967AS55_9FLAO|nr:hypothetical protein [Pelagihabitans pacificus]NHF58475.1 hypothetical protein [Pelagihabitans pacificus]
MKEKSTEAKARKAMEEWELLQESRKVQKIHGDLSLQEQHPNPQNDTAQKDFSKDRIENGKKGKDHLRDIA